MTKHDRETIVGCRHCPTRSERKHMRRGCCVTCYRKLREQGLATNSPAGARGRPATIDKERVLLRALVATLTVRERVVLREELRRGRRGG